MTSLVIVHDATHANIAHLPPGPSAGYTTGTPDIRWTVNDWTRHPAGIRICQDPTGSDATADVFDVEPGAGTFANCPGWAKRATASYQAATRPGQRHPAIYMSAVNVTSVVNALNAGGVKAGIGLWVANWNLSEGAAAGEVAAAAGPFPIIGVQFSSGEFYDTSVFATAWRSTVSAVAPPAAPTGPYRKKLQPGETLADVAPARSTTQVHLRDATRAALTVADINEGGIYYTTRP